MSIAVCIGCGCDDLHACVGDEGPCSWLVVEYDTCRGVCSCCQEQLERWNAGERSILMLVAKIIREGEAEPYFIEKNAMGSFSYFLDTKAGDKFTLEWVEMAQDQFEALPQFEHVRLAKQWVDESNAAIEAEETSRPVDAKAHWAEAERLSAAVSNLGFEVRDLVDFNDLPMEPAHT